MKILTMNLEFTNEIYTEFIKVRTELIRDSMEAHPEWEDHDLSGYCYEAVGILKERLKKKYRCINIEFTHHHGEQRHHPRIPSKYWHIQHDWLEIKSGWVHLWLDPTCSQFTEMYSDIPLYYFDDRPPKWFYSDAKNPLWSNTFCKWLDKKVQFKRNVYVGDDKHPLVIRVGIVETVQHDLLGWVSDWFLHKPGVKLGLWKQVK